MDEEEDGKDRVAGGRGSDLTKSQKTATLFMTTSAKRQRR